MNVARCCFSCQRPNTTHILFKGTRIIKLRNQPQRQRQRLRHSIPQRTSSSVSSVTFQTHTHTNGWVVLSCFYFCCGRPVNNVAHVVLSVPLQLFGKWTNSNCNSNYRNTIRTVVENKIPCNVFANQLWTNGTQNPPPLLCKQT